MNNMNEFKKIKNNNETRYVLETMTAGATGASAIATAEKDIGEVQKRIPDTSKPRNFVAKNAKMGGAGQHKDKKKAEKQGDVKHRKPFAEQGVAEGSDYTPPKLGTVKANLMNTQKPTVQVQIFKHNTLRGDSYWVTKEVKTFKTMDQAQAHVDRINKQGVAEGSVDKKPYPNTWHDVDPKLGKQVDKMSPEEKVKKGYSNPSILKKKKEQGVAEGLQARLAELKNKVKEAYGRYDRRDAYQRDYDSSVSGMDRGNNHRDNERHDLDPSDWYIVKDGKMYKTSVYPRQEQEAIARGYSRTKEEAKSKADSVAEGVDPYFESLRARVEELAKK